MCLLVPRHVGESCSKSRDIFQRMGVWEFDLMVPIFFATTRPAAASGRAFSLISMRSARAAHSTTCCCSSRRLRHASALDDSAGVRTLARAGGRETTFGDSVGDGTAARCDGRHSIAPRAVTRETTRNIQNWAT